MSLRFFLCYLSSLMGSFSVEYIPASFLQFPRLLLLLFSEIYVYCNAQFWLP
jgi:hypothetical protein